MLAPSPSFSLSLFTTGCEDCEPRASSTIIHFECSHNDDDEDAIHPSQPAPHSAISRLKKEDHPAKFAPLPNGGSECGAYKLRQRLALTSSVKVPAMHAGAQPVQTVWDPV